MPKLVCLFVCHVIVVVALPDIIEYEVHCHIADSAGIVSSKDGDGRTYCEGLHGYR